MEHDPLELSLQQKNNSPDKFWEGFLGQKVTQLGLILKEHGSITAPDVIKALDEAISGVPKNRKEFVSKDELLLRALELCAKENNGFVDEKLEKGYIDTMVISLIKRLQEYDFDTVSGPLQEAIGIIVKDKGISLRDSSLDTLRDKFWERFGALKAEEYK